MGYLDGTLGRDMSGTMSRTCPGHWNFPWTLSRTSTDRGYSNR